jgi:hypothetical protein
VCGAYWLALERSADDLFYALVRKLAMNVQVREVTKTLQTELGKAMPPFPDRLDRRLLSHRNCPV